MSVPDNTSRRLKEVLDIMAAGTFATERPNGGVVLAEAVARIPFAGEEVELLSGGIPRGHRMLTKATADLVKAGWMTKGSGGWAITEDGLRATVAFPTVDAFAAALAAGTPVPADTPLPTKPPARKPAAKTAVRKPAPKKAPATKTSTSRTAAKAPAPTAAVVRQDQPTSVALAGSFGTILGALKNWDPSHDSAQMRLDAHSGTWKLTVDLPAGHYSYKAVVNGTWDENYGAFGVEDGANHEFEHRGGRITFHYDHATKDVLRGEI